MKEQQIEYLISILPGLENNEEVQQKRIVELDVELRDADAKLEAAQEEKAVVLQKLEEVICSIKRP